MHAVREWPGVGVVRDWPGVGVVRDWPGRVALPVGPCNPSCRCPTSGRRT